ncbi:extracellular solute-binding protein [Sanguibacter sp. HDW7]|uniref:extracellular solute-binding protein n=1 Tax=Sanguibacter sp. HDW7 TaxID=2714931 RepID=UPI00140C0829|nr:extracellular solute-binding protein [Sanguibacter sp. HDW7]QIK82302.1 extracellular solute-binding protein [Sanguibacter sp. HDW7]
MKRLHSAAVATATMAGLVLGLTACSGNDAGPAAGGDGSGAPTELRVWVMGDAGKTLSDVTKDFTTETGIKLKIDGIPWENVNDRLTTAVASGSGPDVVQVGLSLLPTFADAGVLEDISAQVKAYPELDPSNFPDAVSPKALTGTDAVTSVPWVSDTRVLFYRTDILTEAGIAAPPATWDEMRSTAKTLAARGDGQYGYYIPLWDNTLPVQYTWQAGGEVLAADGSIDLATPEFIEAVDHWTGFFTDGSAPSASDWDQTQGFISGATPMVVSGPYLARAIQEAAPELDGKWDVATLPTKATGTSLFAGSNLAVWKGSKNADAAVKLLAYLAKPEVQVAWYEAMSELPTTAEALDKIATTDPKIKVYADQLKDARTVPMVPGWDLAANEMATALTDIATNGADRDARLAQLRDKVAEIEKNY